MNARERLFAVLRGEPADRVPIWLLFPYHTTSYYVDVRTHPAYVPVFEASKQRAVMLNRRNLGVARFTPEVVDRRIEFDDGPDHVTRWTLAYRGRTLTDETRNGPAGLRRKKLLTTDEDLEIACSLPIDTDADRIARQLEPKCATVAAERREFPPQFGSMMLDLGEPVNWFYWNSDLESYAIWSLTHGDLIAAQLDRALDQCRRVYDYTLDHALAEVYFFVGSELAAPPLVRHETFQRWVVPYAQDLIHRVQARGAFAIQHFHGFLGELLHDFVAMAPNALHTVEAPPVGNCTLAQAYDVVGDRIALVGNIQYDEFRSLSPDAMRAAVKAVLDEAAGRRLILSPTAGPYDPNPPPRLIENYLAFLEAGWEYGER